MIKKTKNCKCCTNEIIIIQEYIRGEDIPILDFYHDLSTNTYTCGYCMSSTHLVKPCK